MHIQTNLGHKVEQIRNAIMNIKYHLNKLSRKQKY